MKRFSQVFAIIVLVSALSSCGFVFGMLLGTDVGAFDITVDDSGAKGLESVTVFFASYGAGVDDVEYALVLSNGTSLSYYSDVIIYEGTIDLDFNETEMVTITRSQIDAYMSQTGETAADGNYYVGVLVDPLDRLDDTDPSDNQESSTGQYSFLN